MTAGVDHLQVSRLIDERRRALAEVITEYHYRAHPELAQRYGAAGRARCVQDNEYHLAYLSDAIAAALPMLFTDYIAWTKVMLASRGILVEDLTENLQFMRDALASGLPADAGQLAIIYVDAGFERLPKLPSMLPEILSDDAPFGDLARNYLSALLRRERHLASRLIIAAAQSGTSVRDIYLHVFQRCQYEIGRLWQMNQISVAEEHYCTAATQMVMSQLYPYLFSGQKSGRTLVAACVAGDLHEIGARFVSDFLELEGWNTIYLGANVPSSDIVKLLNDREVDVLALSATMTFHVRVVADLIADIRASPAGVKVKIMVGGYPFNIAPELWRRVGADAWARDALEAISVADRLTSAKIS